MSLRQSRRAEFLSDLRIQRGVLEAEIAIASQVVDAELDPLDWHRASLVLDDLEPRLDRVNSMIADMEVLSGDLRALVS